MPPILTTVFDDLERANDATGLSSAAYSVAFEAAGQLTLTNGQAGQGNHAYQASFRNDATFGPACCVGMECTVLAGGNAFASQRADMSVVDATQANWTGLAIMVFTDRVEFVQVVGGATTTRITYNATAPAAGDVYIAERTTESAAELWRLRGGTWLSLGSTNSITNVPFAAGRLAWDAYDPNSNQRMGAFYGGTLDLDLPAPPINTVAPAITGTAQTGQTLTCSQGAWNPVGDSYAFQWKRGGVNISGATANTYVLQVADESQNITCTVTATNADGSASANSNTVTPTAAPALDFEFRLSGGAANADPALSIGGAKSSVEASGTLFDNIDADDSESGLVDYRCIYIHNNDGAESADVTAWISNQFDGSQLDLAIGVATEAAGATVAAIANDETAPAGVVFSAPTLVGNAISLGTLAPGQGRGLWLRRTLDPEAVAATNNEWEISIEVTPL